MDADPVRIAQVIANLLNNAAKYNDKPGHILVSADREGDEAVVRVLDDGVGIDKDLLPRVFDLFTQADRSVARSQGGLGIGLTLVRSLVERHGGRVEAFSEGPGGGASSSSACPPWPARRRARRKRRPTAIPPPPPRRRSRGECSWSTTTPTPPAPSPRSPACGSTTSASPTPAPPPWNWPRAIIPTWSFWTSACPA